MNIFGFRICGLQTRSLIKYRFFLDCKINLKFILVCRCRYLAKFSCRIPPLPTPPSKHYPFFTFCWFLSQQSLPSKWNLCPHSKNIKKNTVKCRIFDKYRIVKLQHSTPLHIHSIVVMYGVWCMVHKIPKLTCAYFF